MGIGDVFTEKKKQIDEWLKNQSTPVEIAAISAGSAVQGTPPLLFFFACRRCSFFLRRGGDRSGKTTRFLPNVRLSARFFHSLTELISLSLSLSSLCDGKYRRCARLRARDGE